MQCQQEKYDSSFRCYILRTAAGAGDWPASEIEKEVLPFPFGDYPVPILEAFGKGPGKHRFECGGVELPLVTGDCIVRTRGNRFAGLSGSNTKTWEIP